MNMPLALVELLIGNHEQIATSLKNQAFSYRDKKVSKYDIDLKDGKWQNHVNFLRLHYALRAYRRRWDQAWKPLSRNLKREGQQVLRHSLYNVFDALLECWPHIGAESPSRAILTLPCALKEKVRLDYLSGKISRDVQEQTPSGLLRGDRIWVDVRTDGLTFRQRVYRSTFREFETVAEYSVQMETSKPTGCLGSEMEMFSLVRLLARQTYEDLTLNPGKWVPVASTLKQEHAEARKLVKGLLGGLTRSNVKLLAKYRSVLTDVFDEIQKEML
jgi:hypothetical protein